MRAPEAPSLRVWVQCILVDRHRLKKELIVGRVNGKASMATATSLAARPRLLLPPRFSSPPRFDAGGLGGALAGRFRLLVPFPFAAAILLRRSRSNAKSIWLALSVTMSLR